MEKEEVEAKGRSEKVALGKEAIPAALSSGPGSFSPVDLVQV